MAELTPENGTKLGIPQQKKPFCLPIFKFLVRFPVICFGLTISVHLAAAGVTLYLYLTGVDVFAFDFEQLPLVLNEETSRRRDLAWKSRNKYEGHLRRLIISKAMPWWPRGYAFDYVEMMYQHKDNVLTQAHLQTIKEIEERIYNEKNYTEAFCQLEYDQTCTKALSLFRFFDGTFSQLDDAFNDPGFSDIIKVLNKAKYYNETKADLSLLVGAESIISPTKVQANIVRTRIPIGGPLTYHDGAEAERPKYITFLREHLKPEVESIRANVTEDMTINYYSDMLFRMDLNDQAFLDLRLAIGSQAFIFIFILIHTESLWVAFWATFSIFSSFLLVNLFYRFALGYEYFGFFHLLSIFIILGIGADDIFIFYDSWRLNCSKPFPSNAHRLSATYVRAARSMLATSLTTMAAFLVSGLSPLLAVSTFGLFSGLLVLVNYLSVITFFPTVVLVYTLRVLPIFNTIFGCVTSKKSSNHSSVNAHVNFGFQGCPDNFNSHRAVQQSQLSSEYTNTSATGNGMLTETGNAQLTVSDREKHYTESNQPVLTAPTYPKFTDMKSQNKEMQIFSEQTIADPQPQVTNSPAIFKDIQSDTAEQIVANIHVVDRDSQQLYPGIHSITRETEAEDTNNQEITDTQSNISALKTDNQQPFETSHPEEQSYTDAQIPSIQSKSTTGCFESSLSNGRSEIINDLTETCSSEPEKCAQGTGTRVNGSVTSTNGMETYANGTGIRANGIISCGSDTGWYSNGIVRCADGTETHASGAGRCIGLNERVTVFIATEPGTSRLDGMGCCNLSIFSESNLQRHTKGIMGHGRFMFFLSTFLKTKYYRLVNSLPAKIIVPIFFVALVALFLAFVVQLTPDERQVQMFRSSHNYGRAQNLKAYAFGSTSPADLTRVKMVWGLKETDMSECNLKSSKTCEGKPIFDPKFEFGSPETQDAILGFCRKLRNLTQEQLDSLRVRRNLYTNKSEIACFMEAAQEFFWAETDKKDYYGKKIYPENFRFDLPFTDRHLKVLISANSKISPLLKNHNFTRPLEVALGYWLSKGWTQLASDDYYTYRNLLGEVTVNETRTFRNQKALSYNTGIKYIAIEINTTMYANTLGYEEGLPIYNAWEALMKELVKDLPESLSGGFQLTTETWHWLRIQQTLANSAVYGVTIGLALALPILILTTQNIIIGFMATVMITLVTVCVVGMIPMAGWRLGVLESLNLCLVVGLSVDYVVHLAEAYHRCEDNDRAARVRYMLETVGTAVLSGAITTSGAAIFMLFAQIQFLLQFGIFMLTTIGFSVLFSLLGFPVIMLLCGPRGKTGSFKALCKKCRPKQGETSIASAEPEMVNFSSLSHIRQT